MRKKRKSTSTKPVPKKKCWSNQARLLTQKEKMLVECLPNFNWSVTKAAISIGYSKGYANGEIKVRAQRDRTLTEAIDEKRREVSREMALQDGWTPERWRKEQVEVLMAAKLASDFGAANTALKQLGQHIGVFELDNEQRQPETFAAVMQALLVGASAGAAGQRALQGTISGGAGGCVPALGSGAQAGSDAIPAVLDAGVVPMDAELCGTGGEAGSGLGDEDSITETQSETLSTQSGEVDPPLTLI